MVFLLCFHINNQADFFSAFGYPGKKSDIIKNGSFFVYLIFIRHSRNLRCIGFSRVYSPASDLWLPLDAFHDFFPVHPRIFPYRSLQDPGKNVLVTQHFFALFIILDLRLRKIQIPCKFVSHRSPSFCFVFFLTCFYSAAASFLYNFFRTDFPGILIFFSSFTSQSIFILSHPCSIFFAIDVCVFLV